MYWQSYQDYLNSSHWKELKQKYILNNKNAKCCICESKRYLTLHHEIYLLEYERLNRDVFITCEHNCHRRIHFVLFGLFKLPLKPFVLRKRRQLLRLEYCLLKRKLGDTMYSLGELVFTP
jgi:hypothetical protein